ncbi:hypothetical protein K9M48_01885 [Candidatus Gracilibacteria bacterium]|nr:hypothetical protein [Candidatus Gracilibacteria bacterium]
MSIEKLDQHYYYNKQLIEAYIQKQNKNKLRGSMVNEKGLQKTEIRKDVCLVNEKRIELLALSDNKNKDKFNEAYNLIIGSTERKFIKGYKSLIGTLLGFLKTPEYKQLLAKKQEEVRLSLDMEYAVKRQLGSEFLYKFDSLIKNNISQIGSLAQTIDYCISELNKYMIDVQKRDFTDNEEEILKRMAFERYNGDGLIKNK